MCIQPHFDAANPFGHQGVLGRPEHAYSDVGLAMQQIVHLVRQHQFDDQLGVFPAQRRKKRRQHFDADDLAVFDDEDDQLLPVVAIVGRPNVGKSTLVNRVLGRREAVVEDVPGVTRDRVTYEGEWSGHRFLMVDTGGWEREAQGMAAQVAAQAERAMFEADVVCFVLDATVGATDADEDVVKVLRRTKKPVILVANKVDDARADADAAMLWSLGLGEPYAVSSLHGRGFGELLDAVVGALPDEGSRAAQPRGPRRVEGAAQAVQFGVDLRVIVLRH